MASTTTETTTELQHRALMVVAGLGPTPWKELARLLGVERHVLRHALDRCYYFRGRLGYAVLSRWGWEELGVLDCPVEMPAPDPFAELRPVLRRYYAAHPRA